MEISIAKEKHVTKIVNLWEEFSKFHEPFDPRFPMATNARSGYKVHLREQMAAEDTKVLVALDKRRLVGYAVAMIRKSAPVWKREKCGYILEMAVTADSRRQGTGTQLLEEILAWFKSENLDMIELSVAAKNKVGYGFWKKHGFKDYLHHLYLKP